MTRTATIEPDLRSALSAAEEAERLAAEAGAQAAAARETAERARAVVEERRQQRQRRWATDVLAAYPTAAAAAAEAANEARLAFDRAVADGTGDPLGAFAAWYDALIAARLVQAEGYRAATIVGSRTVREPDNAPHLRFDDEIARAATQAAWNRMAELEQAAADRRERIFDGEETP